MRRVLIAIGTLGLFCAGMIWLLLELRWIENVVGGGRFVLLVLVLAALPAWWAGRAVGRAAEAAFGGGRAGLRLSDADAERRKEGFSAGMLAGAGLLALAVSSASWFNHEHAWRTAYVPATVVGREHREGSARGAEEWRLIVRVQGRREDVAVSAGEWARQAPGDAVTLRMLSGALEFPVLCSSVLRGRCAAEPIAARAMP